MKSKFKGALSFITPAPPPPWRVRPASSLSRSLPRRCEPLSPPMFDTQQMHREDRRRRLFVLYSFLFMSCQRAHRCRHSRFRFLPPDLPLLFAVSPTRPVSRFFTPGVSFNAQQFYSPTILVSSLRRGLPNPQSFARLCFQLLNQPRDQLLNQPRERRLVLKTHPASSSTTFTSSIRTCGNHSLTVSRTVLVLMDASQLQTMTGWLGKRGCRREEETMPWNTRR